MSQLDESKRRRAELASRVRIHIRETMLDPEIQLLIRQRVEAELRDEVDVKIVPTLLKIAAGTQGSNAQDGTHGPPGFPGIHIHLDTYTDDQLERYAKLGIRPELSPPPKTIDLQPVKPPPAPVPPTTDPSDPVRYE